MKKVQHPTGGVVGEILVKEGDEVEAGQIVLRLDDTVTRATLGVVRSQLDELMAREARLLAEREDADVIVFPAQLTSGREEASATTAVTGEQKLFESRQSARTGQRSQLRERIAQTNEEIRGLSAQQAAKESRARADREGARRRCRALPEESRLHLPLHPASARPDADAGRARPAHRRHRPRARQDQRNRAADHPGRSGFSHRGAQGPARVAGQDRRAQGARHRGRGPAQARRPARAADRLRAPARGAHRGRRDQQRRDHHADRAARRRARGGGQGRSQRHRPDRHRERRRS